MNKSHTLQHDGGALQLTFSVSVRGYDMIPSVYSFSAAFMQSSDGILQYLLARFCSSTVARGIGRHRFCLRPSVLCTIANPVRRQFWYKASVHTLSKSFVLLHWKGISRLGFSGSRREREIA